MRGAAALALAMSASLLVLGPASAQRSTTGSAPALVSPAAPLAPAPSLVPPTQAAPAAAPTITPSVAVAPPSTPAPSNAPALAPLPKATAAPAPVPPQALAPKAVSAPPAPPPQALAPARAPAALTPPAPARQPTLAPPQPATAAAPPPEPRRPSPTLAAAPQCDKPGALGVTRTVEIDTAGGPGFGFEHFRQHDFLRNGEVVLTFDDGPWVTTPAVLKALAEECVRATFFPIGKHATFYPEILRQVAAAGHTVGSHTWSHANLARAKSQEEAIDEIEKDISAVNWALEGKGAAPFFRFPALRHPPELVTYLGNRNVGVFSTDMDSFDFKMRKPEQVINSIMAKLKKSGKGIVLMHDFQNATAQATPELLRQLKAGGYKIVHMRARDAVATLPKYDEELKKDQKLPTVSQRPTSSVVKTVE